MMRSRLAGALLAATSLSTASTLAHAQDAHAPAGGAATSSAAPDAAQVAEVIVTAERRQDTLQRVPLAVSAFSAETMKAQRLDNAANLQLAVPNLTYSAAILDETNYQIRGIGYQIISAAADSGVSVHENNVPLTVSRLANAEFYDLERIEVLRGPQGTLYGRNATGGVINSITAKPGQSFSAAITGEYGNYNSARVDGFVNVPLGDMFSVRVAGIALRRDGFLQNAGTGNDIDGRKLNSTRITAAFKPNDRFNAWLMWERFAEDDNKTSAGQLLCIKDPGPSSVGGVAVTNPGAQLFLSRGCLPGSISDPRALGTENTVATLYGALAYLSGLVGGDANAGVPLRTDRRTVDLWRDPSYHDRNQVFTLGADWDVLDGLKLGSLTAYSEDHLRNAYGFGTAVSAVPFNVTPVTPGGVFVDPQIGRADRLESMLSENFRSREWSEELRLQSSFAGPLNFNLGGLYLHLKRFNDSFIMSNALTAYAQLAGGGAIFIDPNAPPTGEGHNYFLSRNPYTLTSKAAFGEVYWTPIEGLKFTAGLRYTSDQKSFTVVPVELLAPGRGAPGPLVQQAATFNSTTGRLNVQWTPKLSFTDATMVYATYSRGYKGGGFNPPDVSSTSPTYGPELVDAYEIGTKNELLGRTLQLNLTGFYYDYKGYQITQLVGLSTETSNVNAKVHGFELESVWQPTRALRFNTSIGYLHTRLEGGSSVDAFDRTQGDPNLTELKSISSACVGPTAAVAKLMQAVNAGILPPAVLLSACPTDAAPNGPYASANPAQNPLAGLGVVLPTTAGVPVSLTGHQLPNAPHWTVSVGAQYKHDLGADWLAVARADYYFQDKAFATIFNSASDRLPSWSNVNLSLTLSNSAHDLSVQFYAKNLFDKQVTTAALVGSDAVGLTRGVVTLDPRLYGVSVSKRF